MDAFKGIEVLKGKEKITLNTNQKELYIDLCSLLLAMGITMELGFFI
ncbi:hypothetical protein AB3U99_02425 [Niallia sp. JL1B1071]